MKQIPLTNGSYALVDDDDFERISRYTWGVRRKKNGDYAMTTRKVNGVHMYMARMILSAPPDMLVDHISMDTLDNRKCNLRLATKSQNGMNRGKTKNNKSGLKGVHFEKYTGKWRACIAANKTAVKFPRRNTKEEAYEDYLYAMKEMHGEFSRS